MKYYYHYTKAENAVSIISEGLTGTTFMCENEQDCLLFAHIYNYGQEVNIFIYKIKAEAVEDKLEESFDHSYEFFKCRAFTFTGTIDYSDVEVSNAYTLNAGKGEN